MPTCTAWIASCREGLALPDVADGLDERLLHDVFHGQELLEAAGQLGGDVARQASVVVQQQFLQRNGVPTGRLRDQILLALASGHGDSHLPSRRARFPLPRMAAHLEAAFVPGAMRPVGNCMPRDTALEMISVQEIVWRQPGQVKGGASPGVVGSLSASGDLNHGPPPIAKASSGTALRASGKRIPAAGPAAAKPSEGGRAEDSRPTRAQPPRR